LGIQRDIDVMMFPLNAATPRVRCLRPHPIDTEAGFILDGCGRLAIGRSSVAVDSAVFAMATRNINVHGSPVKVRTFRVGTLLHIQQLIARLMGDEDKKYSYSHQSFADFAQAIAARHPEEFLPPTLYEPFGRN
jgi:hypothetical protein